MTTDLEMKCVQLPKQYQVSYLIFLDICYRESTVRIRLKSGHCYVSSLHLRTLI